MRVITIGDVHGESIIWEVADLKKMLLNPNLEETEYDLYVFLGDYIDSKLHSFKTVMENFLKIIQLKKNYPEKVVLLIGNHDLRYMFGRDKFKCSGTDEENYYKYLNVYKDNMDLFVPILKIKNYVFSHAGMSLGWLLEFTDYYGFSDMEVAIDNINNIFIETIYGDITIDVMSPLYYCSIFRGGPEAHGGIFWADARETMNKIVPGLHQIVGHTPVKEIKTINVDSTDATKGSITYINTIFSTEDPKEIYFALNI